MAHTSGTRVRMGKLMAGTAVLLPAAVVLGAYLLLHEHLVGRHLHVRLWPWIAADALLLGIGALMMRGEEL